MTTSVREALEVVSLVTSGAIGEPACEFVCGRVPWIGRKAIS